MTKQVVVIPGDGIGPELTDLAITLLKQLDGPDINLDFHKTGFEVYRQTGSSVTEKTLKACRNSDAILFGATTTPPNLEGYKSVILTLRQELGLHTNLRPIVAFPKVRSPIKHDQFDILIFRENTEGLYSGSEFEEDQKFISQRIFTENACRRIIQAAINAALEHGRKKITLVHKANVIRLTDGKFLQLFQKMTHEQLSGTDIVVEDMLVDTAVMMMITNPQDLDIVVTSNLFGDILSDAGAALMGGVGMAYSGNYGDSTALFEPVHGSAPDIVGKDVANPTAILMSVCMMLEFLEYDQSARQLQNAVFQVLMDGYHTPDIGGNRSSSEFVEKVLNQLRGKK